jgi:hypothetical protein
MTIDIFERFGIFDPGKHGVSGIATSGRTPSSTTLRSGVLRERRPSASSIRLKEVTGKQRSIKSTTLLRENPELRIRPDLCVDKAKPYSSQP